MNSIPELERLVTEAQRLLDIFRRTLAENEELRTRSETLERDLENVRTQLAELQSHVHNIQAERAHIAEILQAIVEDLHT